MLSTLFLGNSNSFFVLAACGIIFIGFLVGTALDSLHYESSGFLYGLFSALTTATHAIVIKKSLHVVGDNTLDLVYYNNLLSAALLLPWVLFSGELALASDMLQIEEGTSFSRSPLGVFLAGSLLTVSFIDLLFIKH